MKSKINVAILVVLTIFGIAGALYADFNPPIPNPSQWAVCPYAIQDYGTGQWHHSMTAVTAIDSEGNGVVYIFKCETSGFEQEWEQTSPHFQVDVGYSANYRAYSVKTRDGLGNETSKSTVMLSSGDGLPVEPNDPNDQGDPWIPSQDGLIAHWKLDETSGDIAEDSAGTNDGTVVGNPAWADGIIGGALDFNGSNNYISISDPNVLYMPNQLTVSLWINPADLGDGGILGKYDNWGEYNYAIWYERGQLYFQVGNAGLTKYDRYQFETRVSSLEINEQDQWYHIVGTYDSSQLLLYIDGVEVASAIETRQLGHSESQLYIGTVKYNGVSRDMFNETEAYFDGLIDDVRIYNYALDANEIGELYGVEPAELIGIEIVGPNDVVEESSQQYAAIGIYDNGTTEDITDLVVWSMDTTDIAVIDSNGLLETWICYKPVNRVNIAVELDEVFVDRKQVAVLPICPSSSALDFDGVDDYVVTSYNGTPNEYSVALWYKLDEDIVPEYGLAKALVSKTGYQSNRVELWSIWFSFCNNDVGLMLQNEKTRSNYAYVTYNPGVFEKGQWHYVVAVGTTTEGKIYFDGELKATVQDDFVTGAWDDDADFKIAKSYKGLPERFFNGQIDDVAIFDRALSAQEIRQNMYHKLTGSESGLVGYWNFDEGSGGVASDSSGNGNDGALVNDPNWVTPGAPAVCTTPALVERNLGTVIEVKENILDELAYALNIERQTIRLMYQMMRDRTLRGQQRGKFNKARMKLYAAYFMEHWAKRRIEGSIGSLNESIDYLKESLEPKVENEESRYTNRRRRRRR